MSGKKHCRNCGFHGVVDSRVCCDYIGITEHKRPCKFMDGCEVWMPENGAKKKRMHPVVCRGHITPEMERRALELYMTGMSDPQIGMDIGVSRTVVRDWRQRNKLPSNFAPRNCKIDYDAVLQMYSQGMTDDEIAGKFEVKRQTISAWRRKKCLPINKRKGDSKHGGN